MANKRTSGREMANSFPENSLVRMDSESVGQRLLHAIGTPFDEMDKALHTMRANQYVSTFNIDEIDILYKAELPATYSFTSRSEDPLIPQYDLPVVRGLFISDTVSGWYSVSGVNSNSVQEFWYEDTPTRFSTASTVTGTHILLAPVDSTTFPNSSIGDPHIEGHLLVDVNTNQTQIVSLESSVLTRGLIRITGTTRKGTEESESMVFPWGMKQKSLQQWEIIKKVEAFNFPSGVMIGCYSGHFADGPYLDAYNRHYSEYRNKIDTFWDVGVVGTVPTIDKVGYVTDEWQQLVAGFDLQEVKRSWETLDTAGNTVSGIDLAIQPFSTRTWIVDGSNQLYCYDLSENMATGISLIRDRSVGCHVKLDFEAKHVVQGENIQLIPFYERPLQEIRKYRIWYQTPSGDKYGLNNGQRVAYTADFWIEGEIYERNLEPPRTVRATERGEYLFVLEVTFRDNTTQTYKALVTVDSKTPLAQYDLSGIVATAIDGIDFDSDQRLWVKSGSTYYKLNAHYDKMLVDYKNKVIYFRENYTTVQVD